MILKKRGQFSHGDFIIGFIIFSFALVLFFKYSNYVSPASSQNEFLLREGKLISDTLLSEGYPSDWNSSNVVIAGITNGNMIINESKLSNLANLDYSESKSLFKSRCEYYLYFTDKQGNIIDINNTKGYGYPGVNITDTSTINADDIAKTTRLVIKNSSLSKMVILTW